MSLDDIDLDKLDLSGLSGMDLSSIDLGDLGGRDFGSMDLEGMDLSGLSGMDFDSLGLEGMDLGGVDLDSIANLGVGDFDLGGAGGGTDLDSLIDSMGGQSLEGLEDVELGDALALAGMGDFDRLNTYGMTPEQLSNRDELMALGGQDFGSSVDMGKAMDDFGTNLQGIYDTGGFTSQWQNVDGRKVQVYDDGTGMAVNPSTGASRSLSESEVASLIKAGKLNTFESGYNTATGGTKIAPGGGTSVTLKDGTKGTLLSNGRVVDSSGTVVGTGNDVRGGGGGGGGGSSGSKTNTPQSNLGSLLPLLLMMLAMNRGSGGGGSGQNAVIPGLTATQKQTPYAQQQRAPGYRPGQGGISYFDQTQYTPKMAAGGGISGLLHGPGDGVSDSIPAVIDGGMAGGGQPAKVARGEYIFDARSVAALGNGSTDAGAERLDKMREDILRDDRKAGVGKDSKAYRHLLA